MCTLALVTGLLLAAAAARAQSAQPASPPVTAASGAASAAGGSAAASAPAAPTDPGTANALIDGLAGPALSAPTLEVQTTGAGGSAVRSIVAKAPRVVVAGYRVAFIGKTGAGAFGTATRRPTVTAMGLSQSQSKRLELLLANVSLPLQQAITDRLYADFLAQLQAQGLEVLPREALDRSTHFTSRVAFSTPKDGPAYQVSPTGDPRHYTVLAPTGMPLLFLPGDGLGDRGAFALDQLKGLMFAAMDLQAVPLVAQVTIDFAETTSSGRSSFTDRAEVDGRPVVSLAASHTHITALHATNTIMGEWGRMAVDKPAYLDGEYAQIRVEDTSPTAVNIAAVTLSILSRTAALVQTSEKRHFVADPARYGELALRVGASGNRALVATTK